MPSLWEFHILGKEDFESSISGDLHVENSRWELQVLLLLKSTLDVSL